MSKCEGKTLKWWKSPCTSLKNCTTAAQFISLPASYAKLTIPIDMIAAQHRGFVHESFINNPPSVKLLLHFLIGPKQKPWPFLLQGGLLIKLYWIITTLVKSNLRWGIGLFQSFGKMKLCNVNLKWRFLFWDARRGKFRHTWLLSRLVLVPPRSWCAKSAWFFLISFEQKVSTWSDKNSVFFLSRHRPSPKTLINHPAASGWGIWKY